MPKEKMSGLLKTEIGSDILIKTIIEINKRMQEEKNVDL